VPFPYSFHLPVSSPQYFSSRNEYGVVGEAPDPHAVFEPLPSPDVGRRAKTGFLALATMSDFAGAPKQSPNNTGRK